MSAFLVSKTHIDALVWARNIVNRRHGHVFLDMSDSDFGRMLWRENMASLAARYRDPINKESLAAYAYMPSQTVRSLPTIALVKSIDCYEYQACEREAWQESQARAACEAIYASLVHMLPGYDAAPWGIEDATGGAS